MSNRLYVAACALLLTASSFAGTIIHVPANQSTIQAGINAAANGDTVLVAPGTYYENINFNGKAITVTSSNGAKATIIDGGKNGPVVMFNTGEGHRSVLSGFTIQNGVDLNIASGGAGIAVQSASPIIQLNIIRNNTGCTGLGIGINAGSAIVQNNTITNNTQTSCSGGGGGGINITSSNAQILKNVISNNVLTDTVGGGGIILFYPGTVLIKGNLIIGNVANGGTNSYGGGIYALNSRSKLSIVQNVIVGNHAFTGGGIAWLNPFVAVVDNTIANNDAPYGGSAVYSNGFYSTLTVDNNIMVAKQGQSALLCGSNDVVTPLLFASNDVYSLGGAAYAGTCTDHSGNYGNISADPLFPNIKAKNYRLNGGSPAIDTGDNSEPNLPTTDFAGNPRIINGNDLSTAIVDIGAYEFVPVVLAPKSLGFVLQAVGSTTSKNVKLTNAQNKALNVSSYTVPTGYSVSGCGSSIAAFTSCTLTITFHPLTSGPFKGSLVVKDDAGNSPQSEALSGSAH